MDKINENHEKRSKKKSLK